MRAPRHATRFLAPALVALVAGCGAGHGVLEVTVDSPGGTVGPVSAFVVAVANQGQDAGPYRLTLTNGPSTIPPAQTFSISFDQFRGGAVHVVVDAVDANGVVVGSGVGDGMVQPWAVVAGPDTFDWQGVKSPRHARANLVIYELSVRGFGVR